LKQIFYVLSDLYDLNDLNARYMPIHTKKQKDLLITHHVLTTYGKL